MYGAVAAARFPRHHIGDTSPSLYADSIDFQTRADIRIRVRSIVIRIRIRHTAIRIRIVVPAIDHTAHWETLPACKVTHIPANSSDTPQNQPFFSHKTTAAPATTRKSQNFSTGFAGAATRFVASLPLSRASPYATSLVALYAATLTAFTIRPRKARREPTFAFAIEASLLAFAPDTPPSAYA